MSDVGQKEREAQNRVVELFQDRSWTTTTSGTGRTAPVTAMSRKSYSGAISVERGYDEELISKALFELDKARAVGSGRSLYEANRRGLRAPALRRQGRPRRPARTSKTVWLIDWKNPAHERLRRSPKR